MSLQRVVWAETVIEDSGATPNHSLRGMRSIIRRGRPGESNARRKICRTVSVGLILVSQSITEQQVRTHLPIILPVEADIDLRDPHQRLPR